MFEWEPVEGWPPPEPEPPIEPDVLEELSLLPIKVVEARVCALAGHLASATCRWLLLLGEFDQRNGWFGPGFRSCSQWLSWRCGLSMPAARQHVRVARALRGLPLVTARFAAGELSYSKVRSITRIATPELEEQLVDLGLTCTAAQLDAIVATYRRTKALQSRPHGGPARSTTWHWDDDGSLVVRSRLAPDEGALYLAAVDAMRHQLDNADPAGSPGPGQTSQDPGSSSDAFGDDGHGDLCGQDEVAGSYRCSRTDAVVAMAMAALAAGPLDNSGSDRFQVVIHADLDQLNPPSDEAGRGGPDRARRALARGRCHLREGPCVHPATLHRLACDAVLRVIVHGPDGSPLDQGRAKRLVNAKLRRALEERDGRRCRFSGCSHIRFLQAHHIEPWAAGGRTDLDNLILLCGFHHRLLHEHGYSIEIVEPGQFAFCRPDGTWIEPSPELTGHPGLDRLPADMHVAPAITERTTTPRWAGERLDLGYVVSLLFPPDRTTEPVAS